MSVYFDAAPAYPYASPYAELPWQRHAAAAPPLWPHQALGVRAALEVATANAAAAAALAAATPWLSPWGAASAPPPPPLPPILPARAMPEAGDRQPSSWSSYPPSGYAGDYERPYSERYYNDRYSERSSGGGSSYSGSSYSGRNYSGERSYHDRSYGDDKQWNGMGGYEKGYDGLKSQWDPPAARYQDELPEEPLTMMVVNSTSSGAYSSLCGDAETADVVGIDAEWVPDWNHGSDNPISVLQLAFPSSARVYVLQLARLNQRLPQAVQMMLVNPEVAKVGFAVNFKDTAKFVRSGISVTKGSIVDVQERCAEAMGMSWKASRGLSLKRCAHAVLGCNLDKDKRLGCSDWSSEKLTPEQVRYAALDAWTALRLFYHTQ